MSGHSKWSTIKRKKGAIDAQRSRYFSKLIREITAAVKQGGNNVDMNPRLRLAVQNAKGYNMPKENIERAINKGSSNDAADFINIAYEGNGPHGTAFIIECMTDNQNRTIGDVRAIFNKYNGTIGKSGSVAYLFERQSCFVVEQNFIVDADEFLLDMVDFGVTDVEKDEEEGVYYIVGSVANFKDIHDELEKRKIEVKQAELRYVPQSQVSLTGENAEKMLNFVDLLEDLEDVQHVFHNISFDIE
jgi:YebC/PmpR family DNA-binding regulatory protein